MNDEDITPLLVVWQQLVIKTQTLAIKLPETGLNVDVLATLPIGVLVGILSILEGLIEVKSMGIFS